MLIQQEKPLQNHASKHIRYHKQGSEPHDHLQKYIEISERKYPWNVFSSVFFVCRVCMWRTPTVSLFDVVQ